MQFTSDLKKYYRFTFGLRRFLKDTITLEEAEETIRKRMENREENFLKIVEKGIYGYKRSPYLKLLNLSGYEFKDIERLVYGMGIEETLETIRKDGVYVTLKEFKGQNPIVRGNDKFVVREKNFDSPFLMTHYEVKSGATRFSGTRTKMDFEFLKESTASFTLVCEEFDLFNGPVGLWLPILPGSAGINFVLRSIKIGITPTKWFSQIDKKNIDISLKNRLAMDYIIHVGNLFGVNLPNPELVDLNDAYKVAHWIGEMIKDFSMASIVTYPSSAIRICMAAKERGLELDGVMFILTGEPITKTKYNKIISVGAEIIPWYGATEIGTVGLGCHASSEIDGIHLFNDTIEAIQYKRRVEFSEKFVNAFLFTSLLPNAPKILLNVESGDHGMIENKRCNNYYHGSEFQKHIYNIRSFEKLTGEGMTLVGTNLIRIIEEILPKRFGGESIDYQLIEGEDENGFTRYKLLINPKLKKINKEKIKDAILSEIKRGSKDMRLIYEIWSKANAFQVLYGEPMATERGKIFPFQVLR